MWFAVKTCRVLPVKLGAIGGDAVDHPLHALASGQERDGLGLRRRPGTELRFRDIELPRGKPRDRGLCIKDPDRCRQHADDNRHRPRRRSLTNRHGDTPLIEESASLRSCRAELTLDRPERSWAAVYINNDDARPNEQRQLPMNDSCGLEPMSARI